MSCRDLTSGVRAERIGRIYATLAKADEAIVRVRRRLSLFEEVCRVLVDEGRLRMAWVGEIDDHGWVVPVALAGAARGYLDDIRVSVLDVPEGRGPTGMDAMQREERRQALEAELRSSEERFRLATESMLDALTILSPVRDDDGEITDFRARGRWAVSRVCHQRAIQGAPPGGADRRAGVIEGQFVRGRMFRRGA